MADDDDDKKYDPTPKRREEYRKQGRIARARDAGAVAAIAATLAAVVGTKEAAASATRELFTRCLSDPGALLRGEAATVRTAVASALVVLVVPPMVAAVLGTVAVGFAQAGVGINLELVDFKPERLDPTEKIKQMFSLKHGGFEVALALLKVAVVGYVVYGATRQELPALLGLAGLDPRASAGALLSALSSVVLKGLGAMLVVSAADYAHSWFELEQQMKMSLNELKEEMKQEDGDPHVKGKRKAKQRAMARKRMMNDVKTASVVVTNPTHVAVALRYDDDDPAPIVVAKGHDDVALAIRREARSHGIPIVENRPLARAIDADVALGKPVKVEHFAAVARVLAFVFKLRGRRRGGGAKRRPARGTARA